MELMKPFERKHIKKIFFLKIDLPALLAFIFFAGLIFFYLIPGFEKVMMDRKRNMIREMTASTYSLLEYYHSREVSGEIGLEEAKRQAWSAISTIRYGDAAKDYFWITDSKPEMIMHPYRHDLNGKDLSDFRDSKGKRIFVEFVSAVAATGESYVEYMWQWNDDSTRIVPKLSYVRLFKPWDWVIGTGIYIEDVRSEIRKIEMNALIISGIIGVLIIFLLSAITRQSHKIEHGRRRAEEELHRSRELYRTLAEAATEGVLIWSKQGLQANRILLTWLEYSEQELLGIDINAVFSQAEIAEFTDLELFYNDLESRRQEECTLMTKNGHLLKTHAGFSRIILGELKAVLIVFRPVRSHYEAAEITTPSSILNRINTGFFRLNFGKRIRFLYASDPVMKLLGINTMDELISRPVESFFADPGQLKIIRSAIDRRENVFSKDVLMRTKNGDEFRALINLMAVEINSTETLCDGTLEQISISASGNIIPSAGTTQFSAIYLMNITVSSIMRSPLVCGENMTVAEVAAIMNANSSGIVIVTGKSGDPTGVIDAGTIGLRLSEGGGTDMEVFRWMYPSPVIIDRAATLARAFSMVRNSPCRCLIVLDEKDKIEGIITDSELADVFSKTPDLLIGNILTADSTATLLYIWNECRKLAASMVMGNADPSMITMFISKTADEICKRIISLCIQATGPPPCRFSFIQTGSAGRMEQTLSTDQDNAIIYENITGIRAEIVNEYFLLLGRRVNEMLAETGFRSCKGANMAGNPQWCQPLDTWKKYFSDWIRMPGPEELLEISIFFDFRFCYGSPELSGELKEFILKGLKTSDIFFHHMAAAWKQFSPLVSTIPSGKSDIKKMLMPLVGISRLYALRHSVQTCSTIERLIELHSGDNLDQKIMHDSIKAWKDLTSIRLAHHINCMNRGEDPDNYVDFHALSSDSSYFAGRALVSINNLLLKAGNDFYLESL